jgi:lipopolysaccharide transport system ATP-binding protein
MADGPPALGAGERLDIDLRLRSPDDRPPGALVGIVRADGTPVYGVASDHDGVVAAPDGDGCFRLTLSFPELPLLPGGYVVRAHAMDPEGLRVQDTQEIEFTVRGRSRALGLVALPHAWSAGDGAVGDAAADDAATGARSADEGRA